MGLESPSEVNVCVVGDLDVFMSIHEGSRDVWAQQRLQAFAIFFILASSYPEHLNKLHKDSITFS